MIGILKCHLLLDEFVKVKKTRQRWRKAPRSLTVAEIEKDVL